MLKENAIFNNNTIKTTELIEANILVQILFKSVKELVRYFHLKFWNKVTFGRHFEYLIKNCKTINYELIWRYMARMDTKSIVENIQTNIN